MVTLPSKFQQVELSLSLLFLNSIFVFNMIFSLIIAAAAVSSSGAFTATVRQPVQSSRVLLNAEKSQALPFLNRPPLVS